MEDILGTLKTLNSSKSDVNYYLLINILIFLGCFLNIIQINFEPIFFEICKIILLKLIPFYIEKSDYYINLSQKYLYNHILIAKIFTLLSSIYLLKSKKILHFINKKIQRHK